MNLAPGLVHLPRYAPRKAWGAATPALAEEVLAAVVADGPGEPAWEALLELLAVWPDAGAVRGWVEEVGSAVRGWPWRGRACVLGHRATRGEKRAVFGLVGLLTIARVEDLFGQHARRWAEIEEWSGLSGLLLRNVETGPEHLATLTGSPHLQALVSLEMRAVDGAAGGVGAFLGGGRLPGLVELGLASCDLRIDDVRALPDAISAPRWTRLDVSASLVGPEALDVLLDPGAFPSLVRLDVSRTAVTAEALEERLAAGSHPSLREVLLRGTPAARALGRDALDVG